MLSAQSFWIETINAALAPLGFQALGRCPCKGKPYRWKKKAYEFKLFTDHTWILTLNGFTVRYGKEETAPDEVKDYFEKLMV